MHAALNLMTFFVLLSAQKMVTRLAGGTAEEGRLEVFHNGQWQRVCAVNSGEKEALVACRMLGFNRSGV